MSSKDSERPMSAEDQKRFVKTAGILSLGSLVFMGVMAALVYTNTIRLYPSNMNTELVKGYAGRVEFALRYQTLLVVWLTFNIFATIGKRYAHKAINPMDDNSEQHIMPIKLVLNNSYEQIVLSVFAQLIFVSFAAPECILKTIPLVNILQFVGRVTFYYGYPFKRSFGFLTTLVPTLVLVIYNMYSFLGFLFK